MAAANAANGTADAVNRGLTAPQLASNVALSSVAGGVMSDLQGGKFGHGMVSAGLSTAASPAFDHISMPAGQVVVAAIIGGTASSITGGKFANGAVTAAFAHAFSAAAGRLAKRAPNDYSDSYLQRKVDESPQFVEDVGVPSFIRDEGLPVLGRTLDVVGGAGQVALGGAICTGVVTCVGGVALMAQGASNIYEGWTGDPSPLRRGYRAAFGDYADVAYGTVDIGTSVYGLTRSVLKPGSWKLFHYTRDQYVPAAKGLTATQAAVEGAGMASDLRDLTTGRD